MKIEIIQNELLNTQRLNMLNSTIIPLNKPRSNYRHLFVVGCPRSGTTWTTLLIAQHANVFATRDVDLLSHLLRSLQEAASMEAKEIERNCIISFPKGAGHGGSASPSSRDFGLQPLVTAAEQRKLFQDTMKGIYDQAVQENHCCEIIVEQDPAKLFLGKELLELFPSAYFVHVIRDPRSVFASFRAAVQDKWATFPTTADAAAKLWHSCIEKGREIASATQNYREIFYEELLNDPAAQLHELFSWVGLTSGNDLCQQFVENCQIEDLRQHPRVAKGFFRKGQARGWESELSRRDIRLVEYFASEPMRQLGYECTSKNPTRLPWLTRTGLFAERVSRKLRRLGGRLLPR